MGNGELHQTVLNKLNVLRIIYMNKFANLLLDKIVKILTNKYFCIKNSLHKNVHGLNHVSKI